MLQEENKRTKESLQQADNSRQQLNQKVAELEAELNHVRTESRTVLSNIRDQHTKAIQELKERHTSAMQAEQNAVKQRMQEKDAKVEALATQLKQALVHVKALEEAQRRARNDHQAAVAQLEAAAKSHEQKYAELQQQLDAAQSSVEKERSGAMELLDKLQAAEEARSSHAEEVAKLEQHLTETVMHIGTMKGRMEDLEESLEVALARLQVAVDKGAVPPIKPSEIKVLGVGARRQGEVKVSIPYFRSRKGPGGTYHAFVIFVTVNHEQWAVERRYSELLAFQQEIRKQLPGAEDIPFPPKVTIGSRSAKLAEDRREKLQAYLQAVVRLAVTLPGTPVQQDPSKETLLLTLPFLGEDHTSLAPLADLDEDYVMVGQGGKS